MSRSLLRMDVSPLRGRGSGSFRVLYASRSVTQFGTQATDVALLVQAKQLTGSVFAVGVVCLALPTFWRSSGRAAEVSRAPEALAR